MARCNAATRNLYRLLLTAAVCNLLTACNIAYLLNGIWADRAA